MINYCNISNYNNQLFIKLLYIYSKFIYEKSWKREYPTYFSRHYCFRNYFMHLTYENIRFNIKRCKYKCDLPNVTIVYFERYLNTSEAHPDHDHAHQFYEIELSYLMQMKRFNYLVSRIISHIEITDEDLQKLERICFKVF